eukprot:gene5667-6249_t
MRLYSPMEKIVASLHNDDVHTFQDVIQALHALGHSVHDARVLTEQVDQVGHALVYSGVLASYQQLEQCYDKLVVRSGLIFSMMPKEVYQMLPVIPALIRWCLALGEMQEGLRRVIVEELLIDFREQEEEEVEQQEEEGKGKGNAGRKKKRSPYSLSALDSEKWSFYQRFECCKVLEEEEQFPFEVSQLSSFETLSLDHLHVHALSDLVIRFQYDALFKAAYAQLFTLLYPSLVLLYHRHYGTADHSLLHSSDEKRLTLSNMLVNTLHAILLDCGCPKHHDVIELPPRRGGAAGGGGGGGGWRSTDEDFLGQHAIRTKRYSFITRDLEFLTCDRVFCLYLLLGRVDPGLMDAWVDLFKLLQNLHGFKRQLGMHVETEDTAWVHALELLLHVDDASDHFISRALFNQAAQLTVLSTISSSYCSCATATATATASSYCSTCSPSSISSSTSPWEIVDEDHLKRLRGQALLQGVEKVIRGLGDWLKEQGEVLFGGERYDLLEYSVLKKDYLVSLHLPLHRLVARLLLYTCYQGLCLRDTFNYLQHHLRQQQPRLFARLFDDPLRLLAWSAAVEEDLWIRNGQTMKQLVYHYTQPPLTRKLRDLDVHLVQLLLAASVLDGGGGAVGGGGGGWKGVNEVLLYMAKRFEVLEVCLTSSSSSSRIDQHRALSSKEHVPGMLKHFLRCLGHLFTFLPVTLEEKKQKEKEKEVQSKQQQEEEEEGLFRAVARHVVHSVLSGQTSLADIEKVRVLVGSAETVSETLFHQVIATVCRTSSGGNEGVKYTLEESYYTYFNPAYPYLSSQRREVMLERMKNRLSNQLAAGGAAGAGGGGQVSISKYIFNPFHPLFLPEALAIPHVAFRSLPSVLFSPLVVTFLDNILALLLLRHPQPIAQSRSILPHLLHLLTLQIHYLHGLDAEGKEVVAKEEVEVEVVQCVNAMLPVLAQLPTLWEEEVLKDDLLYHHALGFVIVEYFYFTNYRNLYHRRRRAQSGSSHHQVGGGGGEGSCRVDARIFAAFEAITTLPSSIFDEPRQLSASKSPAPPNAPPAPAAVSGKTAAQRAIEEAQARAKAMLAAFADELSDDDDDEEEGEEEEVGNRPSSSSTTPVTPVAKKEDPVCIICREKGRERGSLGLLCFLQPSSTLQHAVYHSHTTTPPPPAAAATTTSSEQTSSVYRVVTAEGCVVYDHPTTTRPTLRIGHLSYNDHVLVAEKRPGGGGGGAAGEGEGGGGGGESQEVGPGWLEIVHPMHGYVQRYQPTPPAPPAATILRNTSSSPLASFTANWQTVLLPVDNLLLFHQHGGHRYHLCTCGHAMHYDCYDSYYSASYAQNLNQRMGSRQLACDVLGGECLCPLCKTLVNTLLPLSATPPNTTTTSGRHSSSSGVQGKMVLTSETWRDYLLSSSSSSRAIVSPHDLRLLDCCFDVRYGLLSITKMTQENYFLQKLRPRRSLRLAQELQEEEEGEQAVEEVVARTNSVRSALLEAVQRFGTFSMRGDGSVAQEVKEAFVHDLVHMVYPVDVPPGGVVRQEDQLSYLLASMPYQAIPTSRYPTEGMIYELLAQVKTAGGGGGGGRGSSPLMWGFLKGPLLNMDLQLLSMRRGKESGGGVGGGGPASSRSALG